MAWLVRFPFGEVVEAVTTHVERSTGNFFVQLCDAEASKLEELMVDIANYVQRANNENRGSLKVGQVCLAKFSDETWYRVRILGKDSTGYQIFFLDYGNSYVVDKNDILAAPQRFLDLSPQCFECELADVQPVDGRWSTEAIIQLEELLIEQTFPVEALSLKSNNVIILRVFQDATKTSLVVEKLIAAGYALKDGGTTAVSKAPAQQYSYIDLDDNTFEDIYVSHSEHPGKFFCQLLKNTTALRNLMDDLDRTYKEAAEDDYQLSSCCQGNPCCARYSEDDMWYRAIITGESLTSSGKVKVQFIDYGNSEDVYISNLKELDQTFLELPVQALDCSLYGVKPIGEEWSAKATEQFCDLTIDKHLVSYLSKYTNNKAELFLFDTSDEKQDLNYSKIMVASGNAIAVKPLDEYKRSKGRSGRRKSSFGIIDLLPNTSENVVITSADSPSEFYCQLLKHSRELEDIMEKLGEYYDRTVDVDDAITLPQPGMICCANYTEDNSWYRALIMDSDIVSRQVKVLYVDYGNSETLSLGRIKELKPQFTLFPQQAIPCSLYGVTPAAPTWTEKAIDEFQKMVLEKELIIHVVGLNESHRYNVSLLETVANAEYSINKLLVSKGVAIAEGVHPGVPIESTFSDYQSPDVGIGSYNDIEVSHVNNLDDFWCHLTTSSEEMDSLMSKLQEYYDTNPPNTTDAKLFNKGGACSARFSEDNLWYRGKVVEKLSNNRFKVHFVDYGNSEVVPLTSLAVINPEFLELPIQSIHCSLVNVSSPNKNKDVFVKKFYNMVTGKELVCRIDERDDHGLHSVLIIDSNECDGTHINEDLAKFITGGGKQNAKSGYGGSSKQICKVSPAAIRVGSKEAVYVTFITSSDNFFCQLAKTSFQLDELMNRMEEHYRPLGENEECYLNPQVGEPCCAMFTEDDGWYRAVVTKVTGPMIGVCYIDYGNSEELPLSRVKSMVPPFTELTAQGFQASLAGGVSVRKAEFEQTIGEKELVVKVTGTRSSGGYEVVVHDTGGTQLFGTASGKEVKSKEVCKVSPAAVTVGSNESIYVTSITSSDNFFCQLAKTSFQLDKLMNQMEEHYRPLEEYEESYVDPHVGEACCAMFTEDDGWYRAVVTNVTGQTIGVCYIDYGNSEELPLSRVKCMVPPFTELTAQGFQAGLAGGVSVGKAEFEQTIGEKELKVKINGTKHDGVYEVVLSDVDGTQLFGAPSKTNMYLEVKSKQVCKVSPAAITVGSKEAVYVTSITSSDNFFCQLAKTSFQLDKLMNRMEEHYRPLGENEECYVNPQVGEPCCAMFTEDDGWYRAVVTKVTGQMIGVCYIDYGNSEELPLSRVKSMVPPFTELTAQGFQASLAGGVSVGKAEFEQTIGEKELMVKITGTRSGGGFGVELLEADGTQLFGGASSAGKSNVSIPETTVRREMTKINLPSLPVGSHHVVYVTSVTSPRDFFCQFSSTAYVLDQLMNKMDERYSVLGADDQVYRSPQVGEACAAKFSEDDGWYRAAVTKVVGGSQIRVCYVDYGNSEVISLTRAKLLKPEFTKVPAQGFHACLSNASGVEGASFEEKLLEKEFTAKVIRSKDDDGRVEVELSGINDAKKKDVIVSKVNPAVVTIGSTERCYITCTMSPENFFCQLTKTSTRLDQLMDQIEEYYRPLGNNDETIVNPQVGDACCAMFTEDDGWYRAVVTKVTGQTIGVCYIDYGNSEELPLSRVKSMVPPFTELTAQGFQAGLSGGVSVGKAKFEQTIGEQELMVKITGTRNDGVYEVELSSVDGTQLFGTAPTTDVSIKDFLTSNSVSPGDKLDVCGSHCESPSLFYCQLVRTAGDLQKLMTDLAEVYFTLRANELALSTPTVGMCCAAQFTVDDAWYRARITNISSPDAIDVTYVDFGNRECLPLERLKKLSPVFQRDPAYAVQCCVEGTKKAWNGNECESFEILTLEQHLIAVVKSVDQTSQTLTVELFDTRTSEDVKILDLLAAKTSGAPNQQQDGKLPKISILPKIDLKATENVLVESAESLDSFVCQLSRFNHDLDTLADLIYEEYQASESAACVTAPPEVDDVLAAQFTEDEMWYRACVSGRNSDGTIEVTFIDYGNKECIPPGEFARRLKPLTKEMLRYPAMRGVHCSLSRVVPGGETLAWTTRAHEAFVRYVVGKSFRAKMTSQAEPYCVILENGAESILNWLVKEKLLAGQETENDVEQEDYYELAVQEGSQCDVYVTSVVNPEEFYVQQAMNSEALDQVMNDLHQSCEDGTVGIPVDIGVGTLCAAQYTVDDGWYRARVNRVIGAASYDVMFVDYGNREVLPRERLKDLSPSLLTLPAQALRCSLQLQQPSRWNSATNERFETVTSDKCLQMKAVKVLQDNLVVTLRDEQGSLVNDAFDAGSAGTGSQAVPSQPAPTVSVSLSHYPITQNETVEVYVSHVVSPGEFYVQLSGSEVELENLAGQCAEIYSEGDGDEYTLKNPEQGMFCSALYHEDNLWYRSQITCVDSANQTATVLFVDHGNSEVVNIQSDLRQLTAVLTATPCQAIKCCLQAHGANWTADQTTRFETAAMDKPLQATFNEFGDNTWSVSLTDGTISLNQLPDPQPQSTAATVPEIKEPNLNAGVEPAVYLVSVASADDVILQLAPHLDELEVLMADIASSAPVGALTSRETGLGCLGRFTEDEAWYRARILESDGSQVRVRYVDYGNEEWLTPDRLAPIAEQFCTLPAVCFACALDGYRGSGTWDESSGKQLMELYGESELRCKIISAKSGDISVKLLCDGEDVVAKVVPSGEAVVASGAGTGAGTIEVCHYKHKELKEGDRKEVTCTHIESPARLWCQLNDDHAILDELMDNLDATYTPLGADDMLLTSFSPGTTCCGQFLEDDGWYRAEVLATDDEGVRVRYVDYGNDEVLPTARLRELLPNFSETPCQAVEFVLRDVHPVGEEWSPDALVAVEEFISEGTLVGVVNTAVDKVVEVVLLKITEESEVSLSDLLVEKKFAVKVEEAAEPSPREDVSPKSRVCYTSVPTNIGDEINLLYVTADSPMSIWCQLSDMESDLLDLMESVGALYNSLGPENECVEEPARGLTCCAQFTEDDSWYRGEILEVSEKINVRFVDYGNSEELPSSRVKCLLAEFGTLPRQAIHCSLHGVQLPLEGWSEEKAHAMEEMCAEKCFVGEIHAVNGDDLEVALREQDTGTLLLDELVQAGLVTATRITATEDTPLPEDAVLPEDTPLPEDSLLPEDTPLPEDSVIVEDASTLEAPTLSEDTPLPEDSLLPEDTPLPEDALLPEDTPLPDDSLLPEDTPLPEDSVLVEDTSSLEASTLPEDTPLPDDSFLPEDIPLPDDSVLADDTPLPDTGSYDNNGKVPDGSVFPREEAPEFEEAPEISCDVDVPKARSEVSITIDGKPSDITEIEDTELPTSLSVDSMEQQHIDETTGEEPSEAQAVCEAIDQLLSAVDPENPSISPVGVLGEPENGDQKSDTIPEDNLGGEAGESITPSITQTSPTTAESEPDTNDGIVATDIEKTNVAETEAGVDREVITPSTEQLNFAAAEEEIHDDTITPSAGQAAFATADIKPGDIRKVCISYIQSPSSFYCQLSSALSELGGLMESIQSMCSDNSPLDSTPTVGELCCVQSPNHGHAWCRACVTSVHDNNVDVFLVDYGDTESVPVDNLRAIAGDLATRVPYQALRCCLVDLEPADCEWSDAAVSKMTEVCAGKELEAIFRCHRHKRYDIYLRDPGNDVDDFVNKLLVDLNLAKVTGRDSGESDESTDSNDNNGSGKILQVPESTNPGQETLSSESREPDQDGVSDTKANEDVENMLDDLLETMSGHPGEPGNEEISVETGETEQATEGLETGDATAPDLETEERTGDENEGDEDVMEGLVREVDENDEDFGTEIEEIICGIQDALVEAVVEAEETIARIAGMRTMGAHDESNEQGTGEEFGDSTSDYQEVSVEKEIDDLVKKVVDSEDRAGDLGEHKEENGTLVDNEVSSGIKDNVCDTNPMTNKKSENMEDIEDITDEVRDATGNYDNISEDMEIEVREQEPGGKPVDGVRDVCDTSVDSVVAQERIAVANEDVALDEGTRGADVEGTGPSEENDSVVGEEGIAVVSEDVDLDEGKEGTRVEDMEISEDNESDDFQEASSAFSGTKSEKVVRENGYDMDSENNCENNSEKEIEKNSENSEENSGKAAVDDENFSGEDVGRELLAMDNESKTYAGEGKGGTAV